MVEAYQSSHGLSVAFASEGDQAMARIAPFNVKDPFYVNNMSTDEKDKCFCWDANTSFMLINKVVEKTTKVEES